MEKINCPNCNGALQLSNDKSKLICKYCDSIFPVDKSMFEAEIDEPTSNDTSSVAESLFDIKIEYLNEKTEETFNLLCGFINNELTIDDYLEGINLAAKTDTNLSTENIRKEVLQTAIRNVATQMSADETALFFYNLGIFSKGKDGILVTNKSVFRLTKKTIYRLTLENLASINATSRPYTFSDWSLNQSDKICFSLVIDHKVVSIMLGLICTLAKSFHSDEYKIIVNNQSD